MKNESIRVRTRDLQEHIIPPDRALILAQPDDRCFIIGNFQTKTAHTLPTQPHVFLVEGAFINQEEAIDDTQARQIYIYPHRDLEETCQLLKIDMASLPISSIEFFDNE